MQRNEKQALVAKSILMFGSRSRVALMQIAIQEALVRCANTGTKTQTKRACKVYRNILKMYSAPKLESMSRHTFPAGTKPKSKKEWVNYLLNESKSYIRSSIEIHEQTIRVMKKKLGTAK
jgi:hypothetical protein